MKGGIGTASIDLGGDLVVGALAAVNCFGDVVDPSNGEIIAGARKPPRGKGLANTLMAMRSMIGKAAVGFAGRNTVIGVVATNALLSKEEANKMAQMAQDGLARAIRPAHTMLDGDTIFTLSTGDYQADVNIIGAFAAEVFAQACLRAVRTARPSASLPSAWQPEQGY
jgi:L-aminopeptidase/D-esterase-like protein